jgi:hypothetical protein
MATRVSWPTDRGFRRGYAHGTTDPHGMAPTSEACTPDHASATIFHALGIDPHLELTTPTGRPVQLFREGRVIEKLLATQSSRKEIRSPAVLFVAL